MSLRDTLSMYWQTIQGNLFPWLEEGLGPLTEKQQQLVTVLEMVRLEAFLWHWSGMVGRLLPDRAVLARSFVAKAVYQIKMTKVLIDRLGVTKTCARYADGSGKIRSRVSPRFHELFPNLQKVSCPAGFMKPRSSGPTRSGWSVISPATGNRSVPPPGGGDKKILLLFLKVFSHSPLRGSERLPRQHGD